MSESNVLRILASELDDVQDEEAYEKFVLESFAASTAKELKDQEQTRLDKIKLQKKQIDAIIVNTKDKLDNCKASLTASKLEKKLLTYYAKLEELNSHEADVKERLVSGTNVNGIDKEESSKDQLIKKGKIHTLMPTEDEFDEIQEDLDFNSLYEGSESDNDDTEFRKMDDGDETFYQTRLSKWAKKRYKKRHDYEKQLEGAHDVNDSMDEDDIDSIKESMQFLGCGLKDGGFSKNFKIPADIYSHLFEYQKTCTKWLWELHNQQVGGILGDEMGLGKTGILN
jgi:SNF2 family DNA or RNA helicase